MELRTKLMWWKKRRRGENLGEINEKGRRVLAGRPVWLMSEQRVDAEFHSRAGKEPVYNPHPPPDATACRPPPPAPPLSPPSSYRHV